MKILVLNAGSSSQKSRLYEIDEPLPTQAPPPLWEANADWTKTQGKVTITTKIGEHYQEYELATSSQAEIAERMIRTLWEETPAILKSPAEITGVGHRVVHGGPSYSTSTLITPVVKKTIEDLTPFAPLHNPANLEGIEAMERLLGETPQVAVFDTAFHSTMPDEAKIYPGPYSWYEQGIRRYGFHGTSHQYCAQRTAELLGRDINSLRIINCHLGNGCSLAAIKNGKSIDTTMGFTPLEGLMMGTRSGSIDPSIPLYLQREQGLSVEQVDRQLNKESGLLGISGVSSDMRQVIKAAQEGNARAQLARQIYIRRLCSSLGAMLAVLGGADAITFTGGVGENDAQLRAETCAALQFLNVQIDSARNESSPADQDIATPKSAIRVLVVHTEEDWEIAKECWQVIHAS